MAVILAWVRWIPIDESIYFMQLVIFSLLSLSAIILFVFIIPEAIPSFFKSEWKIKNFFLLVALIFCSAIAKFAVYTVQYELSFLNKMFVVFLGAEASLVVGALLLLNINSKKAKVDLSTNNLEEPAKSKDLLSIKGELVNENFTIPAEELLYVKSSDNYSEFYYTTPEGIRNRLIRLTLKKVEEQIPYDYIIRSHKSYIVNMIHVNSITGNANNAMIHFKNKEMSLPVSRTKREAVINVIKALAE